ncbi:glycosyl hydrolase family 18 protein [Xanthobacter sp. DSM 24535]|uniref:glycoside hydrolase family 18 protein n=1 Tax=Roseixanthobacter psychrophilus TaxID=3119917 RepID=UPI00372C415D
MSSGNTANLPEMLTAGDPGTVTALTWSWATQTVLDFDPAHDTLDFGWFSDDTFTVAEVDGSVVIAIPSCAETYTLRGVTLAELSLANITALNASALVAWSRILDPGDGAFGGNAGLGQEVAITWGWASDQTIAFDPAHDMLDFGWFSAAQFTLSEVDGSTVITIPSSLQTYTLAGVALADLSLSNITGRDPSGLETWATALTAAHSAPAEIPAEPALDPVAQIPPVVATPVTEAPVAETPVAEAPAAETPVVNTPVVVVAPTETPVAETPVAETPAVETPVAETPVVETPVSQTPANGTSTGPILAGYFADWTVYDHNYTISDVPADQLTNLIYAAAYIDADGRIAMWDPYVDTQMLFSAADSVDGVADTAGQGLAGNYHQIAELKAAHPDLKVSITVGGAALSANFSDAAATADSRETFAQSLVDFLKTYPMFDGVDFDWEYPGNGRPEDAENYALLLASVRHALDGLERETGRDYTISVASPVGTDQIAGFNLAGLEPYVDWFNMMAYDFHGTWETTTGHLAPLENTSDGIGIENAVAQYLIAGIDPAKMVLGAPLYTSAWSGVADGGDGGLHAQSTGLPTGGSGLGHYDYSQILADLQTADSGWKLYWDDDAQAAYVYNEALGIFSSVETPSSIALKSEWAQGLGLGGMMFYDLASDATGSAESVIAAAHASWVEGQSLSQIAAASTLKPDVVIGGNGVLDAVVSTAATHDPMTVEITWNWGKQDLITDFSPLTDTLDFGTMQAGAFSISEVDGSTVIDITDNKHSYILLDVTLDELNLNNVAGQYHSALVEWSAALDTAHAATSAAASLVAASFVVASLLGVDSTATTTLLG